MNLVDEIYNVLVERFGVGEVCIKKWGDNRPKVTWKEFIGYTLELATEDIATLCRFSSSKYLSQNLVRSHSSIVSIKGKLPWKTFFLQLLDIKVCSSCKKLKNVLEYSKNISTYDNYSAICRECKKQYVQPSTSEKIEYLRKYRLLNKDKLQEYRLLNKGQRNANKAKYRAAKLKATPNWANLVAIKEIYATCPSGYHVDHIIPLKGKLVCGLHIHENLQHLPALENISKGNRYQVC